MKVYKNCELIESGDFKVWGRNGKEVDFLTNNYSIFLTNKEIELLYTLYIQNKEESYNIYSEE